MEQKIKQEIKQQKSVPQDAERQDLISVIVPVYNIKDCLPRCVDSLCRQTYPHLEILLVDDGSSDGTEDLVDELAEKDTRIRVFHKENGGSSSARNLGIREARGAWIGFVDSDDFVEPSMYQRLMDAAREYQVQMVQISRDEIDAEGNRLPDVCQPPKEPLLCPPEAFMRQLLLHKGDCSFCTKLTARELFDRHQFPEGVLNEDFHLLIHLLPMTGGVMILPQQEYHVFYRIGSNTRKASREEFSRVYMDIVEHADLAEEMTEREYPSLRTEARRFALYQRLDYMLHIPVSRMNRDQPFYRSVKQYLRKHWRDTLGNPLLSKKEKVYLLLLTVAPKTVRRIHGWKMRLHA